MALIWGSLLGAAPGQRDKMSGKVCARCSYCRNVCQPVDVRVPGERYILITCRVHIFYLFVPSPCGPVFVLVI